MQPDHLNVFDFDGTLIKVNSFREITKKLSVTLLKKFQIVSLLALTGWYILRKFNTISHIKFKQHVVNIFEKALTEEEKQHICQTVFDDNVNRAVFERMVNSDNCIICTAAPSAYISRMLFKKDVVVISSLDPDNRFPNSANFGAGKIKNIKAYFKGKDVRIINLYTDCDDDQPLIDFSINAFIINNGRFVKVK